MALRYKIKVETEWKPDPKQTEIKDTEQKPKRQVREVAGCETLHGAIGHVQDVLVHQYEKGSIIFVFAKDKGVENELYRENAEGILWTEKEELQHRLSKK
jgi:hypothetical protein